MKTMTLDAYSILSSTVKWGRNHSPNFTLDVNNLVGKPAFIDAAKVDIYDPGEDIREAFSLIANRNVQNGFKNYINMCGGSIDFGSIRSYLADRFKAVTSPHKGSAYEGWLKESPDFISHCIRKTHTGTGETRIEKYTVHLPSYLNLLVVANKMGEEVEYYVASVLSKDLSEFSLVSGNAWQEMLLCCWLEARYSLEMGRSESNVNIPKDQVYLLQVIKDKEGADVTDPNRFISLVGKYYTVKYGSLFESYANKKPIEVKNV